MDGDWNSGGLCGLHLQPCLKVCGYSSDHGASMRMVGLSVIPFLFLFYIDVEVYRCLRKKIRPIKLFTKSLGKFFIGAINFGFGEF